MEFQRFNLHPHVAAGVKAAGYVKPTPIQKQAIPPVLQGQDVLGLAQTGTGKTASLCTADPGAAAAGSAWAVSGRLL